MTEVRHNEPRKPVARGAAWLLGLGLSFYAAGAIAADARQCVLIDGESIVNQCRETIDVVWCVDLSDRSETCANGFTSEVNLQPGARYPMNPLGMGTQVLRYHVGACLGADSTSHTTEQTRAMIYDCK